jgi:hypothetical protein
MELLFVALFAADAALIAGAACYKIVSGVGGSDDGDGVGGCG